MEWDEEKQNLELFNHVQTLLTIRKNEPLLANEGNLSFLPSTLSEKSFGYLRSKGDETIIVLLNTTDTNDKVKLPFEPGDRKAIDLLTGETHKWKNGKITLKPMQAKIIKITP